MGKQGGPGGRAGAPRAPPAGSAKDILKKKGKKSDGGPATMLFGLAAAAIVAAVALQQASAWMNAPTAYAGVLPIATLNLSTPGAIEIFFERYHSKIPVVLIGALNSWPAMDWTPPTLAARCPDARIPVYDYDLQSKEWASLRDAGEIPLTEYLTRDFGHVDKGRAGKYYGLEMSIRNECPALLEDVRIPAIFTDDLLVRYYTKAAWPTLIAGPKGTQSGLHRDTHNLAFWMALFKGRKHWRVFLDDESAVKPYFRTDLNGFNFNPFAPDFSKQSELGKATVYEHFLEAGELMYIPPGAPHAVQNLEDTIAISGNYLDTRGLEYHRRETCNQQLWKDAKLCYAYDHDFDRHKAPPAGEMLEKSFFEFTGHKDPTDWCKTFLSELRDRAEKRPDVYKRCVPTVEAYCQSRAAPG